MYDNAQALREAASKIEPQIRTIIVRILEKYKTDSSFPSHRKDIGKLINCVFYQLDSRIKSESGIEKKHLKNSDKLDNIIKIPDVLGFRISIQINEDKYADLKTALTNLINVERRSSVENVVYNTIVSDLGEYIEESLIEISEQISVDDYSIGSLNYINKPKVSGYSAYNLYFRINGLGIEIQIMREEMRKWVEETHKDYEQSKYGV